jgi:hypothetical protein
MRKIKLSRNVRPLHARLTAFLDPYFDYEEGIGLYDDTADDTAGPLRYRLVIELSDGSATDPAIDPDDDDRNRIDFDAIRFDVADWRTLDQHPLSATGDAVAGLLYLFDSISPVEIGEVVFRQRNGAAFVADLTLLLQIDAEPVGLDLTSVPVTFDGLSFYTELLPDEQPDPRAARAFAGQYVPTEAYADTPTFDDEFAYLTPKLT